MEYIRTHQAMPDKSELSKDEKLEPTDKIEIVEDEQQIQDDQTKDVKSQNNDDIAKLEVNEEGSNGSDEGLDVWTMEAIERQKSEELEAKWRIDIQEKELKTWSPVIPGKG